MFAPTRALYIKCVKEFKEIRAMNNCYKPTIFNCMAKTLRREQKTRLLLVKKCSIVSFGGSFDAEPPPAATLAGIIRQYFCGSGNEVGTGSGCCQDGRAPPHPTTSPPPNPFSLFHASLSPSDQSRPIFQTLSISHHILIGFGYNLVLTLDIRYERSRHWLGDTLKNIGALLEKSCCIV